MAYLLKKEEFPYFIEHLISKARVVAPVIDKKDIMSRFTVLKKGEGSKVVFDTPLYPAKDFFLRSGEKLYSFKEDKISPVAPKSEKTIFLMNRCDINGVHRNDLILLGEPTDPYYKAKRESAILVEIPCRPADRCSCVNIDLIDCHDLQIIDKGASFILHPATKKGEGLLKGLDLKETKYSRPIIPKYKPKEVKTDNKEVWERYAKECFSCSACTVVCPTCVCFTIEGHLNIDCRSGHKYRKWASCQLEEFTKVAGNHVFRKDRGARGKQRIHCKFIYFYEKFGYPRCVGCGRCNEACPVGINIYQYYEALK